MNQAGQSKATKSQNFAQMQSFLETLKSRGPAENSFGDNFAEKSRQKSELESRRLEEFHRARQQEWTSIYSHKQKENAQEIEEIRQQLKNLAKSIQKFENSVNQAVFMPIVSPGIYHKTFLQLISDVIKSLQEKTNEANTWISHFKARSAKKGYYWQQAGKSGSSFMLNNERAVATSVG